MDADSFSSDREQAEAQRVLRQRAAELAKVRSDSAELPALEILQFEAGESAFGIESKYLREIRGTGGVAALPGLPAFVVGVVNVRGQIWSVVDLPRLLRLEEGEAESDDVKTVLIAAEGMEFAILATAVGELVRVRPENVNSTMVGLEAEARRYLLGVQGDGRMILNGQKLLTDPDLVVNQSS